MGQPLTLVSGTLFGDVKKHVWGYIASCLLKRTLPPLPDGAEQFADPAARKLLDSMTSLVKEGLPLEWGTLRFRAGLSPVEMREVVELTNEFTVGDPSYHVYMLTNLIHQIRVKETARKLAADPSNEQAREILLTTLAGGTAYEGLPTCELPRELPPPDWLFEGWTRRKDLTIFAGDPNAGKSLMAMEIALCVAAGRPPFGTWPVPRAFKVFIVDEENDEESFVSRLIRISRGIGVDPWQLAEAGMLGWSKPKCGFSFRSDTMIQRLYRTLDKFRPEYVIFDSLRAIRTGSEKSPEETRAFFHDMLHPIQNRYDCGLLVLHHTRKGLQGVAKIAGNSDDISGSDIDAASDSSMMLQKIKRDWGDEKVLSFSKTRHGQAWDQCKVELVGGDDYEGPLSHSVTTLEKKVLPEANSDKAMAVRSALTLLQSVPKLNGVQLRDALQEQGWKPRTTRTALVEVQEHPEVEVVGYETSPHGGRPTVVLRYAKQGDDDDDEK